MYDTISLSKVLGHTKPPTYNRTCSIKKFTQIIGITYWGTF